MNWIKVLLNELVETIKKTDEDIAINSMNKPEVVNSMVGSVC